MEPAPFVAQLVSAAGVTGLVFVLVAAQALLGRLAWGSSGRPRSALALAGLLGPGRGLVRLELDPSRRGQS